MDKIVVVIPTAGKKNLLERTLSSLSECVLPDSYLRTVVVENGGKFDAEIICKKFENTINCNYIYAPEPSKSKALNFAARSIHEECYIVFFDNDIRFKKKTILAYSLALKENKGKKYFGGPFGVDYEVEPPTFYKCFLPLSAKGWHLPTEKALKPADFLGFNWAVKKDAFLEAGGYDEKIGPGSLTGVTIGDEYDLMMRLNKLSYTPHYVSQARVYHYVPKEKCSFSWTLNRKYKGGMSEYLLINKDYKKSKVIIEMGKNLALGAFYSFLFSRSKALTKLVEVYRFAGIWKGMKMRKKSLI